MSALRSFYAYTNVAPVSPSISIDGSYAAGHTKQLLFPCSLVNLDGAAAAVGWFQVFDLAVAPTSTVSIPLKSVQVTAAGPLPSLFQSLGSITLKNGLFCAMSSTEAVYTAVATNFDVWGEVEEFEGFFPPTEVLTIAGDLVTGVDALQVWSEAQGPRRLFQVDVICGLIPPQTLCGLFVFGKNLASVNDGDFPVLPAYPIKVGTQVTFRLGRDGLTPNQLTNVVTLKKGCTLAIGIPDANGKIQVLTRDGNNLNNIRAYYKNT